MDNMQTQPGMMPPEEDKDAQLYDYLRSKFDPNTDGYKQRQEQERQLADQRRQDSDRLEKQAGIQDMIGGMLEAANVGSSINGERVVGPGMGTRFNDRAVKMRQQAQDMGGLSRKEEMERKKDEDAALFKYLSDKKTDRYHQDMLSATKASRGDALNAKHEDKVNKEVTNLSEKLDPMKKEQDNISALENELGFKLEEYDPNTKTVRGKPIDLPGVSLPMVGRVGAYSSDAKMLNSKFAPIFNQRIQDRSGAAVSDSEMERIKEEFAAGLYNTEEEMIAAAAAYKKAAINALQRREAGFTDEAKGVYKDRGGSNLEDFKNQKVQASDKNLVGGSSSGTAMGSSSPQTRVKDGITYRKVSGGWEEVE